MKKQNGITLMVLIITVIIMLILAVIAISSVSNTDILSQTEEATSKLNKLQQTESDFKNGLINELKPDFEQGEPEEECEHKKQEKISAVLPTCTKQGWTEGTKCSSCKAILVEQQPIEALGHQEPYSTAYSEYSNYEHYKNKLCIRKGCDEPNIETKREAHDYSNKDGICASTEGDAKCLYACTHIKYNYDGSATSAIENRICTICGKEVDCTHEIGYKYEEFSGFYNGVYYDTDKYHLKKNVCTLCNYDFNEISLHEHEYNSTGVCKLCNHICGHRLYTNNSNAVLNEDGNYDSLHELDITCDYCNLHIEEERIYYETWAEDEEDIEYYKTRHYYLDNIWDDSSNCYSTSCMLCGHVCMHSKTEYINDHNYRCIYCGMDRYDIGKDEDVPTIPEDDEYYEDVPTQTGCDHKYNLSGDGSYVCAKCGYTDPDHSGADGSQRCTECGNTFDSCTCYY